MSEYIIQDSTLTNIGNAIRSKTGSSSALTPSAMASVITNDLVKPSGTLSITENDSYDVKNYASVNVNVSGGGGGGTMIAPFAYQSSTITSFESDATGILDYAFHSCIKLTSVSFPNASYIGASAFYYCFSLTTVSFPNVNYINHYAFQATIINTISLPNINYIGNYAFNLCMFLTDLYLTSTSICSLPASIAFKSTPIDGFSRFAGRYGSIYVPSSLLSAYQSATNWTYFSSRFVGI